MRIAVIALGKIGLPVASYLAQLGHTVYGYDIDRELVAKLSHGDNPLRWEPSIQLNGIIFTNSLEMALNNADVAYVLVPTPVIKNSNVFSANAVIQVRNQIRDLKWKGLIIVGSILDPRTVDLVFDSSLMAYCPPLVRLGRVIEDLQYASLHLFGWSQKPRAQDIPDKLREFWCLDDFYHGAVIEGDFLSISLARLAISTTLAVRVAWANEIAEVVRGFDASVETVFRALHADPRIGPEYNVSGWPASGSSLPRDLSAWSSFSKVKFISEAAIAGNASYRHVFVSRILDIVGSINSPRVAVLGLPYNPGALDLTKSKGVAISRALIVKDILVKVYDPMARMFDNQIADLPVVDTLEQALENTNVVVLATAWPEFIEADFGSRIVIDVSGKKRI